MANAQRQKLVVFPDINLIGVFIRAKQKDSDPEYLFIHYKPLSDTFRVTPPKTEVYPFAIHRDNIITHMGSKNIPGVESEVVYVQTSEPGGFLKQLTDKKDRKIKELESEVDYYRTQATTSSVDAENANAGVSRKLSEIDKIKSRRSSPSFPQAPILNRDRMVSGGYNDEDYEDFENR